MKKSAMNVLPTDIVECTMAMIVPMTVPMAAATIHMYMNRTKIDIRSVVMVSRAATMASILGSKIKRINNVIMMMSMRIPIMTKWSLKIKRLLASVCNNYVRLAKLKLFAS